LNFSGIDDGTRDASGQGDGTVVTPPVDGNGQSDGGASLDGTVGSDALVAVDAPAASDAGTLPDAPAFDAPPDGPCPSATGPSMVVVANFCIDSTEVTVDQYSVFLAAKAGVVDGQPPICSSWNGSFVPSGGVPAGAGSIPIVNVNWCQAYAYCAWAGKHLCGAPDGGPGDQNRWGDPVDSAWFHACSRNGDGLHDYPYGNAYDPTLCNGADYAPDAGQARPALTSCEGGYPGIFDLSGNVWEWEDRCWPTSDDAGLTGPGDFCFVRGGAFTEGSGNLTCVGPGVGYTRGSQTNNIGIRCCSP
jgi:formylglycine-generating enzyme required for sulfatase activity